MSGFFPTELINEMMKRKSSPARVDKDNLAHGNRDRSKQQQLDAFYQQEFLIKQRRLKSQKLQRFVLLTTIALIIVLVYMFGDMGID